MSKDNKAVIGFGVVDIGSNAVKMLRFELQDGEAVVAEKRRERIRLGSAVFSKGRISKKLFQAVVAACVDFAESCKQHGVDRIAAIATSATREAENGPELAAEIHEQAGFPLEIISGEREAQLLAAAVQSRIDLNNQNAVLIDLGGGSAEVAMVKNGKPVSYATYPLGALRILHQVVDDSNKDHGKPFLKAIHRHIETFHKPIRKQIQTVKSVDLCVACGGSLDRLSGLAKDAGQLQKNKNGVRTIARETLDEWAQTLGLLPTEDRIERHGLFADRADTIVPAAIVAAQIARIAEQTEILIPRVDLRTGLVEELRRSLSRSS